MDIRPEPRIVVCWPRLDEANPEDMDIFTAGQYADWAETNHLTDTYPWPDHFYGLTGDGHLTELAHTAHVGPYSPDDWATVTHTWTTNGGTVYAVGTSRRDGRA